MTGNSNITKHNRNINNQSEGKISNMGQKCVTESSNINAPHYNSQNSKSSTMDPPHTSKTVKQLQIEGHEQVLHEPQLDTILMVENTIKEAGTYLTKKSLLESLPRKVQYQTFNRILDYLESSNKIMYDGREIIWIFPDSAKLKKLLDSSVRL